MQKLYDGLGAFAGVMGAGGVAAAAASAHMAGGARLGNVALILLVHAVAVLVLTGRAREAGPAARIWLAAALVVAVGATLFSADIALLTLRGARFFPLAAPTGGATMILGWLIACGAGVTSFVKGAR